MSNYPHSTVSEIKRRTVETNGIRMHIAESGAGPLVVLCHVLFRSLFFLAINWIGGVRHWYRFCNMLCEPAIDAS